jgi:hypothetical protein
MSVDFRGRTSCQFPELFGIHFALPPMLTLTMNERKVLNETKKKPSRYFLNEFGWQYIQRPAICQESKTFYKKN